MKNPFGDDAGAPPKRPNPFGEEGGGGGAAEAANRMEHAARKVRNLRSQLGAEGLTLSATRELIDEISAAFDAAARALRELAGAGASGSGADSGSSPGGGSGGGKG